MANKDVNPKTVNPVNKELFEKYGVKTGSFDRLMLERIKKLELLRERGVNPYPYRFDKDSDAASVKDSFSSLKPEEVTDSRVSVAGRIIRMRVMGKALFFTLRDQSGDLQVYATKNDLGDDYNILKKLDIGDIVGVKGFVFATKTGEITVHCESFSLLCKSIRPLPEKYHGLRDVELRYRQRYVDLIMNPEVREVFVKRAKIIRSIKNTLESKGFLSVETPVLQPIYGGANARPFVTHHNALDMDLYLRISNELYLKRLLVGGFERVYEFVKDFRNEGIDRTHNPEFTQVEWYQAYGDYEDGMRLFEEAVSKAAIELYGSPKIVFQGVEIDLTPPWRRLRMVDAIKEFAGIDVLSMSADDLLDYCDQNGIEYDAKSWGMLVQAVFEAKCEEHLVQPTFIIDHPIETTPLAKPHRNGDSRFVERFEPYINTWEVGNGYSELNDPLLQRRLFEEQVERGRGGEDETHPMDEDFVTAIEYGMPPTSGVGMGVDRIVMLLTDSPSIRDVILFPTMKPRDDE